MASSMRAVTSTQTAAAVSPGAEEPAEEECTDQDELSSSLRSCANDPDFAVICAFFQKFSRDLGIDLPNFKKLQEWLTNTNDVPPQLRDLHIKLLRKTRKTVHEKSWESALSKFCFTYSAQDAWEVERFGYKKSNLAVKLRILRELLESQFERNAKFRAKILTLGAESLRLEPVGRDRFGHSYWLTQDDDCNLRIYQEHLDEEIWQVVATNRDEFVNLIARLRGNEVVLPSKDIGIVDEDTSSSNSCAASLPKPPPPEEKDDSQEEEGRIPKLSIKLTNGKLCSTQQGSQEKAKALDDYSVEAKVNEQNTDSENAKSAITTKKRALNDVEESLPPREEFITNKKIRPTLLDSKRVNKPSKYEKVADDDAVEDEDESTSASLNSDNSLNDIDSVAAEEIENDQEEFDEGDDDSYDNNDEDGDTDDEIVGEATDDPTILVQGEGSGKECTGGNTVQEHDTTNSFRLMYFDELQSLEISEAIEEETLYVFGEGTGKYCLVGNNSNVQTSSAVPPAEPKATFFFGEPGCLKLSPIKSTPKAQKKTKPETPYTEQNTLNAPESEKCTDELRADKQLTKNDFSDQKHKDPPEEYNIDKQEAEKNDEAVSTKNSNLTDKLSHGGTSKLNGDDIVIEKKQLSADDVEDKFVKVAAENHYDIIDGEKQECDLGNIDAIEGSVEESESSAGERVNKIVLSPNSNDEDQNKATEKSIESDSKVKLEVKENTGDDIMAERNDLVDIPSTAQNSLCLPVSTDTNPLPPSHSAETKPVSPPSSAEAQEFVLSPTTEKDQSLPTLSAQKASPSSPSNISIPQPLAGMKKTASFLAETNSLSVISPENQEAIPLATSTEEIPLSSTPSTETKAEFVLPAARVNSLSLVHALPSLIGSQSMPLLPSASSSSSIAKNRKRRLADFLSASAMRTTSESELELHSENYNENISQDYINKAEVGGKRLKMRPKVTNTELRKKVEAQKSATGEITSSSSGEEDAQRHRKHISPKKLINKYATMSEPISDERKEIDLAVDKTEDGSNTDYVTSIAEVSPNASVCMSTLSVTIQSSTSLVSSSKMSIVTKAAPPSVTALVTATLSEVVTTAPVMQTSTTTAMIATPLAVVTKATVITTPPVDLAVTTIATMTTTSATTAVTTTTLATPSVTPPTTISAAITVPIMSATTSDIAIIAATTTSIITSTVVQPTVTSPAITLAPTTVTATASVISTPVAVAPAPITPLKVPTSVKQKPTLAEIIEKKLKKTPDRSSTDPEGSAYLSTLFSPHKKPLITKPLKKNLLTQIRQEESDEEAIPKKRTSGTVDSAIAETDQPVESLEQTSKKKEILFSRKTPERQRKRRNSEQGNRKEMPEVILEPMEEFRGKIMKTDEENDVKMIDLLEEKEKLELKPDLKADLKLDLKLDLSPNSVAEKTETKSKAKKKFSAIDNSITATTGEAKAETGISPTSHIPAPLPTERRSGRRGAGTKFTYTELPQAKRTRAASKSLKKDETTLETFIEHKSMKTEDSKDVKSKERADKIVSQQANVKDGVTENVENEPTSSPKVSQETKVAINIEIEDNKSKSPAVTTLSASNVNAVLTTTPRTRGPRKKREVDTTNIIETTESETPVRQSRRIAQQKIREEAERRKIEEIALRTMKEELKKKKKAEQEADATVLVPSGQSSSEESEVETKKKIKKKIPGKDGWSSGSSEEAEEPEEEDEEPQHEDTDPGSPLFKSDHEFSPESDLENESEAVPMKRARTARKEDAEEGDSGDEEACQKCGKSDHPEWILLCDKCDKGYHCSCLSPVLFYIPEGDWYCPPCQQEQLITALELQLKEFDELVERKRIEAEEVKRLAEVAEREAKERFEREKKLKELRKQKHRHKGEHYSGDESGDFSSSDSGDSNESEDNNDLDDNSDNKRGTDIDDDEKLFKKASARKKRINESRDKVKRSREDRRNRRRGVTRGTRSCRRHQDSESGTHSDSENKYNSNCKSDSTSSSSSATDSDDEPIYKLRKRRQINVSYRLNAYDDLINSALKKEMDELAGAGNLGRGKDITTIIEADKEEKARQKQLEEEGNSDNELPVTGTVETESSVPKEEKESKDMGDDGEPLTVKVKIKTALKKKPRKLTTLDISSEEDNGSDEDFKTSSFEDDEDEDEDTSISVSTNTDSSLEIYRSRNKGAKKKQRKAARRAARERRKDRRFVVDESDESEEQRHSKSKKKSKEDSDYSESETGDDDLSELSENVDSADLCDDTTSEDSDAAWQPSKRKKQRKSNTIIARKSPKLKSQPTKKPKRVEYSDDDISESEEEIEDGDAEDDGKGSGKQPRSQPLKSNNGGKSVKSKGKGKGRTTSVKKKKKMSDDNDNSFSDSGDSTRRTRGRRYAYLEDFDDDSSDGGIKPGVKRPDTPPEEREKFIQKQEEIKRMLAEKNAEGAKLAATPRLTPIKSANDNEKKSPAKPSDLLSTVPLSVIRQAKALDIDYLQRKGEPVADLENVDDVDSFDDADLPDDLPEDMDEDAIARMVEEEEEFGVTTTRDLPTPDEVVRTSTKLKSKEGLEKIITNPSLAAMSQITVTSPSGLQEPLRKRLPMPTMHPPLLRHQFPSPSSIPPSHLIQRHPVPPTHLLHNALSTPLGQPLNRGFSPQHSAEQRMLLMPPGHSFPPPHLLPGRHALPSPQSLPNTASTTISDAPKDLDSKPRGRRKKITPLRDPLQKQQAAAAATAAAHSGGTSGKSNGPPSANNANVSSVIKSPTSASPSISIATQPQLYKPSSASGPAANAKLLTIPRPPIAPAHASASGSTSSGVSGNVYSSSASEASRFYGPPQQNSLDVRQTQSGQRQRVPPPQVTGMAPHTALRPTYGPPPPLRGSTSNTLSSHVQPPSRAATGLRSPYPPNALALGAYGAPSPARHAPSHLNPYRPHIYGNPSFQTRAPPAGPNIRPGTSTDYAGAPRGYPPYGYYPLPPPLTTSHQSPISTTTHSTASPSSVIVSGPSVSTAIPLTTHNTPALTQPPAKSSPPSPTTNSKIILESQKKLTTLEAYSSTVTKSPLAIGTESSGSRSSPCMQQDCIDDSCSIPPVATGTTPAASSERQASEFSGLVSYFSSQHDDYNT